MPRWIKSLQFQQYTTLAIFVALLTVTAIAGVVAGQVTLQAQYLARLALNYELKLHEVSAQIYEPSAELPDLIEEITGLQNNLRSGSDEFKGIEDIQLLEMLSRVETQWQDYQASILQYVEASDQEQVSLLDGIKIQRDTILASSNQLQSALQPTEATNPSIRNLGILTTIFVIIPVIITIRVVRSIYGLRDVTNTLAAGDLNVRAPTNTITELADLGADFNRMASVIQQRENDLMQLNAGLEKRVQERTEELQKAYELAEESARLKSEFLSVMSHELRTPLNAVIGYTSIMLEGIAGKIDDEAEKMLGRINQNADHLLGLINNVLDLAKLEAGRMEIASRIFSPHQLTGNWMSQVKVLAEAKNLDLQMVVDPELPEQLYGDPERISQIALNLLSNAIKFTDKGCVRLELSRQETTWQMKVIDEGIGIPPHALAYIFDQFRQVDGSTKRARGGTGLGLPIVQQICQLMHGSVQVSSELGKGSIFTVTLPLVETQEPEVMVL